ncbi:hypothetical protein GCM10009117_15470 [Gangjinia marincola]|uniref:DUF6311 domain-containing protein n=2 Tax=Gangjinia marincola TaxID=578463 RepID=A0ABP3XVG7_9FLAO
MRDVINYTTAHKASKYSLILPGKHSAFELFPSINEKIVALKSASWDEVGNYLGLGVILLLFVLFLRGIHNKIYLKINLFKRLINENLFATLFSATLLLLFAMAIPFRFGMTSLVPAPLAQLVGLGRFAWPFYFVVSVMTPVCVERYVGSFGKNLAIAGSLLILTEGVAQHLSLSQYIAKEENILVLDGDNRILPEAIVAENFQAIIPLPFYHKYGKKNEFEGSLASEKISMQLSYETGLPLMSAILSRPSSAEANHILSVFSEKTSENLLNNINSQDILVVYTGEKLQWKEQRFLNKCLLLTTQNNVSFYKLGAADL